MNPNIGPKIPTVWMQAGKWGREWKVMYSLLLYRTGTQKISKNTSSRSQGIKLNQQQIDVKCAKYQKTGEIKMQLTQIKRCVLFSGEVIYVGYPQRHDGSLSDSTQHVTKEYIDPHWRASCLFTSWGKKKRDLEYELKQDITMKSLLSASLMFCFYGCIDLFSYPK